MIEIRILAVTGLLVTMTLVIVAMVGALALGRWLRGVGERALLRRRLAKPALREGARMGAHAMTMTADAERRVRMRQAAWRLRC
jgi:hypothetical protein